MTNRKPANNMVILFSNYDDKIIGKFSPKKKEEGSEVMTPAATQADAFLKEIMGDSDHELHSDLIEFGFLKMNATPELIQPTMELTL